MVQVGIEAAWRVRESYYWSATRGTWVSGVPQIERDSRQEDHAISDEHNSETNDEYTDKHDGSTGSGITPTGQGP